MKRISILIALIFAFVANSYAQSTKQDLIGLGMSPELATAVAAGIASSGDFIIGTDNDPQRKLTFGATSDTALTLKFGDSGVTALQNLVIGASTADTDDDAFTSIAGGGADTVSRGAYLQVYGNENGNNGDAYLSSGSDAGADIYLQPLDDLIFTLSQDSNRLIAWDSSSDTALRMQFGDGGTTATQALFIGASTADADDDSTVTLGGGGAGVSTQGALVKLEGNEVAGGGDVEIQSGNTAGSDITFATNEASADILFYTAASTLAWTMTETGTLMGSGTGTIGWTVTSIVANTACSTRCTTPAVMGFGLTTDSAFPITGFFDGSSASSDICLCAGAS